MDGLLAAAALADRGDEKRAAPAVPPLAPPAPPAQLPPVPMVHPLLAEDEEERLWIALTHRKLSAANGAIVHVPPVSRGKGRHLIELPAAQTGSADASPRTKRARSELIDTVIAAVSAPADSSAEDKSRHLRTQVDHWQARHTAWFQRAARKLTVRDMLSLKATTALPWSMLRTIRSFLHARGMNVFPSELKVREIAWDHDLEYSTGHVDVGDKPRVPYIRVDDLWTVIRTVTLARHRAGALVWWPHQDLETLSLSVHMDKGGHSTKLMLTWQNTSQAQCNRSSLVIALYEAKQNHEAMRNVFGPLLRAMGALPRRFRVSKGGDLTPPRDSIYRSAHCAECKTRGTPSVPVAPEGIDITRVEFTYGADVTGLHELLGTSGHASTNFCPCCTATLDQLDDVKGKVHAVPGSTAAHTVDIPPVRTLAHLLAMHEEFIAGGSRKKDGADCGGAVRQCLLHTEIAHNIVPPVLHIVSGVANTLLKKHEALCAAAGGDVSARLKTLMRERRIYRTKHTGGLLKGECAMRLLGAAEHFAALLQPGVIIASTTEAKRATTVFTDPDAHSISSLFTHLHSAALLGLRSTPLCDHELDSLGEDVHTLAAIWQARYPGERFTPKLHMLCIDIPQFARQHRTVTHAHTQSGREVGGGRVHQREQSARFPLCH